MIDDNPPPNHDFTGTHPNQTIAAEIDPYIYKCLDEEGIVNYVSDEEWGEVYD